jgi:phenylalanyl-tRNA synthetase beta chain
VRLIGYENLPTTPPLAPITAKLPPENRSAAASPCAACWPRWATRRRSTSASSKRWEQDLAGNADPIKLLNPIASQMSVMRSSLLGSLLQVLKFNLDRKAERVRVFELGRVFVRDAARSDHRHHRARRAPADEAWPAWPMASPTACSGRARAGRSTSTT